MAEKEYIERMTAISAACKGCNKEFTNEPCEPAECHIQQGLFAIPAADVVEVRHGVWEENIVGFCNVCMECGAIVERTAIKNRSGELNYCPNCGADMRGVKK